MDKLKLELYGTDWCTKSAALRNYLQRNWIRFDDFNVEIDIEAEAKVRSLYEGKLKFPTIVVGTDFIKNPTIEQLDEFLIKHHIAD